MALYIFFQYQLMQLNSAGINHKNVVLKGKVNVSYVYKTVLNVP